MMTIDDKLKFVSELCLPKHFSKTKMLFCLNDAASRILSYTNRHILPFELYWLQCRMAADMLLYLTPDLDDGGGTGANSPVGQLQRIKQDDVEFEGQDADHTFVLALSKQNPNMDFLKDYYRQLEMWRVIPRYRRCPHECRPLRGEPICCHGNSDAMHNMHPEHINPFKEPPKPEEGYDWEFLFMGMEKTKGRVRLSDDMHSVDSIAKDMWFTWKELHDDYGFTHTPSKPVKYYTKTGDVYDGWYNPDCGWWTKYAAVSGWMKDEAEMASYGLYLTPQAFTKLFLRSADDGQDNPVLLNAGASEALYAEGATFVQGFDISKTYVLQAVRNGAGVDLALSHFSVVNNAGRMYFTTDTKATIAYIIITEE